MKVQSIKEQFDKVIKYSQSISETNTDLLFDRWKKAKEHFYKAFGNQYIYELPDEVSFGLSKKAKEQRIKNFLESLEYYYGQRALSDFIVDQEEGFFDNLTISDYNYEGKIISKGSKLVRAFKYFVKDENLLTDLQNQASRIIQESKINGKLCLSIHPLDYLSMSENNYNWRSCHSLDGEYRAGNLSYMVDEATIICYLKGADNVKLPNFPEDVLWNDKKWRVLLYFSNDRNMIFAGRQYPFDSESGMDLVRYDLLEATSLVKEAYNRFGWTKWNRVIYPKVKVNDDDKISVGNAYVPISTCSLKPLKAVVYNDHGSCQFNDVLSSSCYKPQYIVKYQNDWYDRYLKTTDSTRFLIGGQTLCVRCGQKEAMFDSDTMMCYNCERQYGSGENDVFTYCDCCGRRVAREDVYYVGDDYLCPDCFDNETTTCDYCGERVFNNEIRYIEKLNKYVCTWCEDQMEQKEKELDENIRSTSKSSDSSTFKIIFDEEHSSWQDRTQQFTSIDLNRASQAIREINYTSPSEEDYAEFLYDELPF